jgi:hypothetical protein
LQILRSPKLSNLLRELVNLAFQTNKTAVEFNQHLRHNFCKFFLGNEVCFILRAQNALAFQQLLINALNEIQKLLLFDLQSHRNGATKFAHHEVDLILAHALILIVTE